MTTAEANDNSGLLDSAVAEPEQTTESQEQATISHVQPDPKAEDDGPLERPDFWPEKFWKKDANEPDLEGISKSYQELEKQFRSGKHKPPEGGKYNLESVPGLNAEDPVVQSYMSWASKYGISQQAFEDLAKDIVGMSTSQADEVQRSIQQERQALGPNADAIINNMATWGRGMVQKGIWSKEDFDEFKVWGGTARGIQALMKLRETYEGRVPIQSAPQEDGISDEELHQMVASPEYKSNAAYRAKVEKLFEKRYA
jgi:hypothetical protein